MKPCREPGDEARLEYKVDNKLLSKIAAQQVHSVGIIRTINTAKACLPQQTVAICKCKRQCELPAATSFQKVNGSD